mmetsp:Transcript_36026/g.58126  ORF Transcript_36026/g.58126 Transcript_36026/m.58126 type:complete len:244 (-) Transcript_36026:263-994(-)
MANLTRPLETTVRKCTALLTLEGLASSLSRRSWASGSEYGRNATCGGSRFSKRPRLLSGTRPMVRMVSMSPRWRTSGNDSRSSSAPGPILRGSSSTWSRTTTTFSHPARLRQSNGPRMAASSRSRGRSCRGTAAGSCELPPTPAAACVSSWARRLWSSPWEVRQAQLSHTYRMFKLSRKPETTAVLPVPDGPHTCKAGTLLGMPGVPSPRKEQRSRTWADRARPQLRSTGSSRSLLSSPKMPR